MVMDDGNRRFCKTAVGVMDPFPSVLAFRN